MKKKITYFLLLLCLILLSSACKSREVFKEESHTKIIEMTVNDRKNALGIDENPYFSWKMDSFQEGQKQTAYRIIVWQEVGKEDVMVWDSGKIDSDLSVAISYEGEELKQEGEYFWQVTAWDQNGEEIPSDTACFEMGRLQKEWEYGKWIKAESKEADDIKALGSVGEITYDFSMENTHTAFLWGADKGQYGTYYKWSFETVGDEVYFGISHMKEEEVLKEEIKLLEAYDAETFLEQSHKVRIVIEKDKAATFLNDVLIAEETSLEHSFAGGIGLWVTRGEYRAWYDNILVKNPQGDLIYKEDFEKENTIFYPHYLKIEEGRVRADAGYLFVPGVEQPAPLFRKEFETETGKEISSVRAYVTALGVYDLYINGRDVNDLYGAPGQSVYDKEVYYRVYDLTEDIRAGKNVIGMILGHGRFDRAKGKWGDETGLCMELSVHYKDGTRQMIGTDESWMVCTDGPIRSDDFYHGEYYDSRYEKDGWTLPEYDCTRKGEWEEASYLSLESFSVKKAAPDEGVQVVETMQPVSFSEPTEGVYVYDFGKNINGICEITMEGKKNDVAVMRYAEVLNSDDLYRKDDVTGSIWTQNLGTSENTDYYVFDETGEVSYHPVLIYRGFRYLQITGIDKAPSVDEIRSLILTTKNERTGTFESSDESLNRLYDAIYLSQLNNYADIPTDCPQRDERLGWAGDAQVYARTGTFNAYTANFMYKYIDALRASQDENGVYPHIVPFSEATDAANGWSDAGIILVWEMYQQYANQNVIMENLDSMCKYMDHLVETSENFIRKTSGYNDHNGTSYMDESYCNTAQCAYAANLLTKMCKIIGRVDLVDKYHKIYESYAAAFREVFLAEDGSIGQWLPSEYVLALAYELYPRELEAAGAEKLVISLEAGGYHGSTGYITTPHILSVLCKYGYIEEAYRLIMQKEFPSWNYMLEKGNGTLMEGWHAYSENEEGKVIINGSLNHVALGSVGQWFYTDVLGIRRDEANPGYKHFYLEPQVGGNLTYAKGSYNSIYGKIESSWKVEEDRLVYQCTIPANTTATLTLPGEEIVGLFLESGKYEFTIGRGSY